MQTFGLNYEVKSGCTDDFKKTLLQLIEIMDGVEGHVETRLYSDVAKPNSMMIYSNWATKAQFAGFIRTDAFTKAMSDAVSLLESRPTHFAGQNIRLIKPAG